VKALWRIPSALVAALFCAACSESPTHENIVPVRYIALHPSAATLRSIGDTLQLHAEAHGLAPEGLDIVLSGVALRWTSNDSSKVRVSQSGLVTAVGWGSTAVTVTAGAASAVAQVSVVSQVSHVVVSPKNPTLSGAGSTLQLTAQALDYRDSVLPGCTFVWSSRDSTKVRVSPSGLVTALATGRSTVTARTGEGFSDSTIVTVVTAPATIVVTPSAPTLLAIGATRQLVAVASDSNGVVLAGINVAWSSSDTTTIRVSSTGLVTALAEGTAEVTARAGTLSARAVVTVQPLAANPDETRFSVGSGHTCALTPTGAAYCWGRNFGLLGDGTTGRSSSSPVAVSGGLTFRAISAGGGHTCGVTTGGAAYCWGWNPSGQLGTDTIFPSSRPVAVTGGLTFRTVSAGGGHTCALTLSGAAYCWGDAGYGQLGIPGVHATSPSAVPGGLLFRSIVAGTYHTCGITTTGETYCWGANFSGQLGNGTGAGGPTPRPVVGGLAFQQISAGGYHSCGVTAGGAAYCWGLNDSGQVGDGSAERYRLAPVAVASGLGFQEIRAGSRHTCAVTSLGDAYCWGDNATAQLGNGTSGPGSHLPVAVLGGLTFRSVGAGGGHTCGVTSAGSAFCWGENAMGQVGNSVDNWSSPRPVAVAGGRAYQALSVGKNHTCALTAAGAAYCWGENTGGQCGVGTSQESFPVPTLVAGGTVFQSLSAGGSHTCALTPGGTAYCWGYNSLGEVGNGTNAKATSPVPVGGGLTFTAISAGGGNTCGLTALGAAYCWGSNWAMQLGDSGFTSGTLPRLIPGGLTFQSISPGDDFICGVTSAGTGVCWGANIRNQLGNGLTSIRPVPTAISGGLTLQAIHAGQWHGCALTTTGNAYCWGDNPRGQLGDGTTERRSVPVPVAGGLTFQDIRVGANSCGIATSGAAYCWGDNDKGEVGDGSAVAYRTTPSAVSGGLSLHAIGTGSDHACGLTPSGAAYCWGTDVQGRLGDGPSYVTSPVAVTGGLIFGAPRVR